MGDIMLDYYKIGQRIRKYRKAHNLSQEELAEKVSISTTHMSHIETGNTKLSLPVLVDLAAALCVSTDSLLFDDPPAKAATTAEIQFALDSCTPSQAKVIADIIKSAKIALDKHM